MNEAEDLSIMSMVMSAVLLIIPLCAFLYFKMGMAKRLLISALRMSVQLLLIGFFLEYLFKFNNWAINVLWFLVMLVVAVVSVINNSKLNRKYIMMPMIAAFVLSNLFIIIYFNLFIVRLDNIFDAKYIIAVGGMILGNSIRSNVVGMGDFYQSVKKDEALYHYRLSLGASKYEALLPFAKKSFFAAISPMIANHGNHGYCVFAWNDDRSAFGWFGSNGRNKISNSYYGRNYGFYGFEYWVKYLFYFSKSLFAFRCVEKRSG